MTLKETNGPISTIRERCRICYACVRNCPTKAIGIFEDCAEIITHRCIGCGKCVQSCSQNAKVIIDATKETEDHLHSNDPTVAVLGCSFAAFFHDLHPERMVTALKQLGFDEVLEAPPRRADLWRISQSYRRQLWPAPPVKPLPNHRRPGRTPLSPTVEVSGPGVSPMIAIGRFIKASRGSRVRVVYISSCIGGKFEVTAEPVAGAIDTVLTYSELKVMLKTPEN